MREKCDSVSVFLDSISVSIPIFCRFQIYYYGITDLSLQPHCDHTPPKRPQETFNLSLHTPLLLKPVISKKNGSELEIYDTKPIMSENFYVRILVCRLNLFVLESYDNLIAVDK